MNDTTMLIILVALIIGAIISLVFGIKFLIKYSKTRKNKYLYLGIIFTFVIPGILLIVAFKLWVYQGNSMILYGPLPMMEYGPGPA